MAFTVNLKNGSNVTKLDDTFMEQNRALSFAEGVVEGINQALTDVGLERVVSQYTVEVIDANTGKAVE